MFIKPVIGAVVIITIALSCVVSKFYTSTNQQKTTRAMTNKEYVEHMKQVKCLADNVYYEAGNQSIAGKKAVAYVTLNRLQSRNWPNSVCEIVYQKTFDAATRLIVCQFSWVCESRRQPEKEVWNLSFNIAKLVMDEFYSNNSDPTRGSRYFHATYVNPQWNLQKMVQIDDHIFYR
jgi:spore germination cell wall hydrolase CwlJ-like protein